MSRSLTAPQGGDRLAKVMARAGLCSRREAEDWIRAGRVSVNGKPVQTPAFTVVAADRIEVDGAPLKARAGTRLWLYHKPSGLVVTEKDPQGRPTIFEALAKEGLPRVMSVGRLDINTEGLLLLTNDGGLKRVLELPATGWLRRYRVRAHGGVTQEALDRLRDGIEIEGVRYGPIEARFERQQGSNVWLTLGLREGKNREVKNVLATLGLEVTRLIRVSYGPFQLGEIPPGGVETVKARVLRDQLGQRLAAQAGVDFVSEMPQEAAPAPEQPKAKRPAVPGRRPPGGRPQVVEPPAPSARRPGARKPDAAAGARPDRPKRPRPARRAEFEDGPARLRTGEERQRRRILFDDDRPPVPYEPKTGKRTAAPARLGADRSGPKPRSGRPSGRKPPAEPRSGRPRRPRSGPPKG